MSELKVLSNFEADMDVIQVRREHCYKEWWEQPSRQRVSIFAIMYSTREISLTPPTNRKTHSATINLAGFGYGGPVVKDKTFFYVAYEGQREGLAVPSLNIIQLWMSGDPNATAANDFAQAIAAIPGGDATQCTTTIIACINNQPPGVVNPVIQNLFNLCNTKGGCSGGNNVWPLTNIAGAAPGSPNSADQPAAYNDADNMIVKIDQVINPHNQLSEIFLAIVIKAPR